MGRPVRSGARGTAVAREFGSLAVLFVSRNGPVRVTANGRGQPLQPRSAPGLLLEPLAEGWFLTSPPVHLRLESPAQDEGVDPQPHQTAAVVRRNPRGSPSP